MKTILAFACAGLMLAAVPAAAESAIVLERIAAPSLAGNALGMAAQRTVAVYLPPSYDMGHRRYPVMYFLPGYDTAADRFTGGANAVFDLKAAMDRGIAAGRIKEAIVVIADGYTPLGGAFYVNAPANGNWEDYIVGDLTSAIDGKYRTVAAPEGRAIAGQSMGGFGAFHIAMRHPEVYSALYSMSPGFAEPEALLTHPCFAPAIRARVLMMQDTLKGVSRKRALAAFLAEAAKLDRRKDSALRFALAYGMTFAGRADARLFDFPFADETGPADPAVWASYEAGFGAWREKIARHAENLKRYRHITVEVGDHDHYAWIVEGSEHVSRLMRQNGIAHRLDIFVGDHGDKLSERMERHMLPTLSAVLSAKD